jgi:hypothetical protein
MWAGLGGVLLIAAGALMVAAVTFSADSPAGEIQVAEASHDTVTLEELEAFGNASVTFCHTEGTGDQHIITTNINAFLQAGHFSAEGNPLHEANGVHDFIISVEAGGQVTVFNDDTCGAATTTPTNTAVPPTNTPTATQPIATATQQVVATSTPTNTVVPPTNTPTATQPIATSTQQVVATSTPTNTVVPPTNTPTATLAVATSTQQAEATSTPTNTTVPPTNTPAATSTAVSTNTPVPTATMGASVLSVQATPPPAATSTRVAQTLGVQATPPPAVRALPATGSGGYSDDTMPLLIGLGMVLAGSTISLVAMKRRA